jgi:hypothetical protein
MSELALRLIAEISEAISEEAVEPISNTTEIKVYPNPAVDFVTVDLTADLDGVLSLLSASGQMVRSIQTIQEDTSIQMNVQDLPKGVYLVRWVGTDDQVVMKNLIVQ